MLRKIFIAFFLIGLLYTGSCAYKAYRYLVPADSPHRRASLPPLVLDDTDTTTLPPPTGRTDFDFEPPPKEADAFDFGASSREGENFEAYFDDSYTASIDPTVELLCAPGLVVLNALGIGTPESAPLWICVVLFSWLVYGMAIRLAFVLCARYFGIGYSPRSYRYWLWLVPPWRPIYQALRPLILWLRLLRVGYADTDRWATFLDRAVCTFKPGQLLLGRQSCWYLPGLQPIGLTTERGCTVVASPGSGKSNWLTAHCSMWPGNFVLIDPDASVYKTIAPYLRQQGKQIHLVDPFGLTGERSACLNQVTEVERSQRYGQEAMVEFAAVLATGAVKETHGQNEWVAQDARAFLKSLILYVCRYAKPEQRNLVYVRRLLTLGEQDKARPQDDPFFALLASMKLKPDWGGAIQSGAEAMRRSMSQSDGRSIPLSYCIEQTQAYDMPSLARVSQHSDFEYLDLKAKQGVCVFIALPLQALAGPLAGWVRAFFTQTIYAFQRDTQHRQKFATLLGLDEAGLINLDRHLTSMLSAGMRKHGLIGYSIYQSVTQMGDAASEKLGMSEANIFLSTNDEPTLEFLSNSLGAATRTQRIRGNWPLAGEPRNQSETRKLASPGQLRLILKDNVVVTRTGAAPMLLKPIRHYSELPVRWITPSNYYGETRARAFTRRLLRLFTGRKAFQPNRPTISIEA